MNGIRKGTTPPGEVDIVVIGAGLGELHAHYRFRQLGMSVFETGFDAYQDRCEEIEKAGYSGFSLSRAEADATA